MNQFDVHRLNTEPTTLVMNVQGDHLRDLDTRVVVPLLPEKDSPHACDTLHPLIDIGGTGYVLASHLIGTVVWSDLGPALANIALDRKAVTRALSLLFAES